MFEGAVSVVVTLVFLYILTLLFLRKTFYIFGLNLLSLLVLINLSLSSVFI